MEHLKYQIKEEGLTFHSSSQLFSPKRIDLGSKAMLSFVTLTDEDKILDLGCGYGYVGAYLSTQFKVKQVVFSDIDHVAISKTRENIAENNLENATAILSDGFSKIPDNDFTYILSNPPYHSDFSVAKHFIEKGFHHLLMGGKLYMVTKRKDWYKKKLISIFGGVRIYEKDGYFIFEAEKRSMSYKGKSK